MVDRLCKSGLATGSSAENKLERGHIKLAWPFQVPAGPAGQSLNVPGWKKSCGEQCVICVVHLQSTHHETGMELGAHCSASRFFGFYVFPPFENSIHT